MHLFWFKRDLRVEDNRALARAAQDGAAPLFILEPELWQQPDMAGRHFEFMRESLAELRTSLGRLGQPLIVRTGDAIEVLEELNRQVAMDALWSHQETGNDWTYRRDLRVAAWCRERGIPWHEFQNHGVTRGLKSRNGWARDWDRFMAEPVTMAPALRPVDLEIGTLPDASDLGLAPDPCAERQAGGRAAGLQRLDSFLTTRGRPYRRAMSSPVAGATACSRLSPHLAWGTLSIREVTQATWTRQRALKAASKADPTWRGALSSFSGRLHWHCHFIQKLEDEPRIEFENFHRAYDGIRPSAPGQDRVAAWAAGETGLPFVDACMRSLRATGWLNFRMRAMVMATASYHLWLDWRAPGLELARLFTDYEPGIHWSQVQMQSGTTGINTVRIYNPVKQGLDQDPTGTFTRRWVPELADIPDRWLQEPWKAENAAQIIGRSYPAPIVDHREAARTARERIWAVRRGADYGAEATAIQHRHGSRRGDVRRRPARKKSATEAQLELPLTGETT